MMHRHKDALQQHNGLSSLARIIQEILLSRSFSSSELQRRIENTQGLSSMQSIQNYYYFVILNYFIFYFIFQIIIIIIIAVVVVIVIVSYIYFEWSKKDGNSYCQFHNLLHDFNVTTRRRNRMCGLRIFACDCNITLRERKLGRKGWRILQSVSVRLSANIYRSCARY